MASWTDRIKQLFHREATIAKEEAEGGEPVATPPPGTPGDPDRETSTNAQTAGASGQPWPDDGDD
jgi:hypothetical protein